MTITYLFQLKLWFYRFHPYPTFNATSINYESSTQKGHGKNDGNKLCLRIGAMEFIDHTTMDDI